MTEDVYIYYPQKGVIKPEPNDPEHIEPEKHHVVVHNSTNLDKNIYEMGSLFFNIMFHIMFFLLLMECFRNFYIRYFRNDREIHTIRRRLIAPSNDYYHHKIVLKDSFENDICSICLEEFIIEDVENNDEIIGLKCNHIFHKKCVEPWILKNRNCPLCKQDIK